MSITSVYGPHDAPSRSRLWTKLSEAQAIWPIPWMICGDFNIVRFPDERLGTHYLNSQMIKFSDFISHHGLIDMQMGLIDMQMSGAKYTWSNNQACPSMSRNEQILLLDYVERTAGPASFRFETMWFEVQGFKDPIRRWWQNNLFEGSADFILA